MTADVGDGTGASVLLGVYFNFEIDDSQRSNGTINAVDNLLGFQTLPEREAESGEPETRTETETETEGVRPTSQLEPSTVSLANCSLVVILPGPQS